MKEKLDLQVINEKFHCLNCNNCVNNKARMCRSASSLVCFRYGLVSCAVGLIIRCRGLLWRSCPLGRA